MNCPKCNTETHIDSSGVVSCVSCGHRVEPYNNADLMKREVPLSTNDAGEKLQSVEDNSRNNGGETDYYAIPKGFTTHQDVIEQRGMNYAQGNIYKVACTFNVGRHSGTDYERDLNKIIFFAKRELAKLAVDELGKN